MALGMIASALPVFMEPVGSVIAPDLALKISGGIYTVFGLQMFLIPAFFMAENFIGYPEQGQAHLFLLFFMRMFGLFILTVAMICFFLADQPVLLKIFAGMNTIQIFQGPGKAIQMFDVTPKHIVPVVLLPAVGFICAATLL